MAIPEELVRAATGGDQQAFGELFRALYPRVYRTVLGMLGSESEADDVAQEAFLKAWNKRARFNFSSLYSTWVHRIAINCALDALRRRKRWRTRFISLFTTGGMTSVSSSGRHGGRTSNLHPSHGSPESHSATDAHPADLIQQRELGARIEAAVNELPEEQRTVLVLREYEGYSYSEIATAMKIPPGTVMSRLHLARQKLQSILSKELS